MPANIVKSKSDEKKWNEAKAIAKSQGKSNKWPLVMHIYQNMKKASINDPYTKIAMDIGRTIDPLFDMRVAVKVADRQLEKDAGVMESIGDFIDHPILQIQELKEKFPEIIKKLTEQSARTNTGGLGDIGRALKLFAEDLRFRMKMPAQYRISKGLHLLDQKKIKALENELKFLGAHDEKLLDMYMKSLVEQHRTKYSPFYLNLLKMNKII